MEGQEELNLNNTFLQRSTTGWVLVWDLDQTIVGEYSDQRRLDSEELVLNPKAVELLRLAVEAREKDIVSAIFLLTNNADDFFIKVVELTLSMKYKKNYHSTVFDYIMSRTHPFRAPPEGDPPKSLREVAYMMREVEAPIENLAQRVIFIDDKKNHMIANEIPKENYIHVSPPFTKGSVDTTDYSFLEAALKTKKGGRRRTTRKRTLFRVPFQTKRHKKRNLKTHKYK
jgi:hypothetical protein